MSADDWQISIEGGHCWAPESSALRGHIYWATIATLSIGPDPDPERHGRLIEELRRRIDTGTPIRLSPLYRQRTLVLTRDGTPYRARLQRPGGGLDSEVYTDFEL